MKSEQEPSPPDLNKQILEMKKKIQLSEGQRKAAFEDCENERKSNIEDIHKLKKEIRELVKELKKQTQANAGLEKLKKNLEKIVGPCDEKNVQEIRQMLDLQIIDKGKALNLINYQTRRQQNALARLAVQYKALILEKTQKEISEKVDKPTKKATCDLQNSIHAVEVQLREANHITIRYKDIKKGLMSDAARFESNIKRIEEELDEQKSDIKALQQVMSEATQKRSTARGHLVREEKLALSKANLRDRQTAEGKRLVTRRRQELEVLEKRIFQGAKKDLRPPTGDEAQGEEEAETPSPPEDSLLGAFEVLKKATGASSNDEVLNKFNAQKETLDRLVLLRVKAEEEKRKLEEDLDKLNNKLEFYKFAEVKESERKSVKLEQLQNFIEEEIKRADKAQTMKIAKDKSIEMILKALQDLWMCVNPLAVPVDDGSALIERIKEDLRKILQKVQVEEVAEVAQEKPADLETEEKWLPSPYSGLVQRPPVPQPGATPAPPPPPGSDEEEEVPSRTYLKRQAQLVVDAKARRKNARLPQKRN